MQITTEVLSLWIHDNEQVNQDMFMSQWILKWGDDLTLHIASISSNIMTCKSLSSPESKIEKHEVPEQYVKYT